MRSLSGIPIPDFTNEFNYNTAAHQPQHTILSPIHIIADSYHLKFLDSPPHLQPQHLPNLHLSQLVMILQTSIIIISDFFCKTQMDLVSKTISSRTKCVSTISNPFPLTSHSFLKQIFIGLNTTSSHPAVVIDETSLTS